jgi:hypothetical protein
MQTKRWNKKGLRRGGKPGHTKRLKTGHTKRWENRAVIVRESELNTASPIGVDY